MVSNRVIECTFYIPQRRDANLSDGELHALDAWEWLDDEIFAAFGGRTLAPGWYEGFWKDPDTQQRVTDLSRQYTVALPESEVGTLRVLLALACERFQQKVIYLSVAGQVEFVRAEAGNEEDGNVP